MSVVPNQTATKTTHPWSFHCDNIRAECVYKTGHKTREEAEQAEKEHTCMPKGVNYLMDEVDERGMRYSLPHYGKSIVEKLWDILDSQVDDIKSAPKGVDNQYSQGAARSTANAIQLMLPHFYADGNAVVKQSLKRWRIRQGEIPFEPTPGYQYNPPPMGTKEYQKANAMAMAKEAPKASRKSADNKARAASASSKGKSFSQDQLAGIRSARDSGLLSLEDLAKNFKVSVEFIEGL